MIPRCLKPAKAVPHPRQATIPLAPAAPHVPSVMMDTAHQPKHPALKRPIRDNSDKKDARQSIPHAAIGQQFAAPRQPSNHNSP